MKISLYVVSFVLMLAYIATDAYTQSGGPYTLTQTVISSGGGTVAGGTFSTTGTIGQTIAGTSTSAGTFNIRGGFWQNSSAASVSVSGRVLTSGGRGVKNAKVNITDPLNATRQVLSGPLGAYRIDNVVSGQNHTFSITSRRFIFTMQMISVNDDLTNVNFIAST